MYTVAETPTQLTAVYRSVYSIFLEWTFASHTQTPLYVVYYEYAGGSISLNVSVSSGVNSYLLTGLPIGGVHSISIVAVRHLPSDVVGPVDPGLCSHNLLVNSYDIITCMLLQLLYLLKSHCQDLGQEWLGPHTH